MSEPLGPIPVVKGREDVALDLLVDKWKDILRLGQWRVRARYCRAFDMLANRMGQIEYVARRTEALLTVLEPQDYDPSCIFPQDVERTVVHELLHLLLDPICPPGDKDDILEPIIHVLDEAFVTVNRSGKELE